MQKVQNHYVCPNNKQAQFSCAEPSCNNIALKCISSNQCPLCKVNHSRCPRESRIDKILQIAQQKAKNSSVETKKIMDKDLIKKLIDQLTAIRQKYRNEINLKSWGLDSSISDIIFNKNMKDKKGSDIAYMIDKDTYFPNQRFYQPPQFRKDVQQVYTINRQLEERMLQQHKAYKKLAECDVLLQQYEKLKSEIVLTEFCKRVGFNKINQLHIKLKQAIDFMLKLNRIFAGSEQEPCQQDIENFQNIGSRIYNLTFYFIGPLYKQNKYEDALKYILLIEDLFNQNRKEYRLKMSKDYQKNFQVMKQYKAYAMYHQKKYQQAYEYFCLIDEASLTIKLLKMLIEMCNQLKLGPQTLLRYLLLLIDKLQIEITKQNITIQQKKYLVNQKIEVLKRVLDCYTLLAVKDKIYNYKKILNTLLYDRTKDLSKIDFLAFLNRELDCLEWQDFNKMIIVFTTIGNIIRATQSYPPQLQPEAFQIQLKARYKLILLHRHQKSSYEKSAENAVNAVNRYLDNYERNYKRPVLPQSHLDVVKEYLMKFLVFHAQTVNNQSRKLEDAQKAVKLCRELRIKFFQPYFILAVSSFKLGNENALNYQIEANNIYPTDICYFNTAFLQYKRIMKDEIGRVERLEECLKSINKSLNLKPNQLSLFHLRGIVYQNMRKYQQSNRNFQKAQASDDMKVQYDIKKRMAQNYELITKMKRNSLPSEQDLNMLKEAERLYRQCLVSQQCNNPESIYFGLGRTLFFQKRLDQAEQYFIKLQHTDFKSDSYMYRGNIKEEQAKANDDRDFELLQQALKLYQRADKTEVNKENMIRIYKELDQEKNAQELAQQTWIKP